MMNNENVSQLYEDWNVLENEWDALTSDHEFYSGKVTETKALQRKCLSGLNHQTYRIKNLNESLKKLSKTASGSELLKIQILQRRITDRKLQFRDIRESLPHTNGLYLSVILGQVNVSLLSKEDRFAYKQDYERFKLVMTIILLIFSFLLLTFVKHRWSDAVFHFLLVWYYCTLTIREHILMNNGSRIKGWWTAHHFVSTLCAGIILIWPEGDSYKMFRTQLMVFSFCLFCVNLMQTVYQQSQLYRLRALGERHNMDITVEGFHSWMWRGLTFVLPGLFAIYFFQLYNAYTLFKLYTQPSCSEWQVPLLSFIFLSLFLGNFLTTLVVIKDKLKQNKKIKHKYEIKRKYSFGSGIYKPENYSTTSKTD